MSKLLITTLVLLSTLSVANALEDNKKILKKYCEVAHQNRQISKISIDNKFSYTEVCRYDTPWIENMYQTLCNGYQVKKDAITNEQINEINAPEYILFFFDGAADYNAGLAHVRLSPINIDGTEGVELGMGNANGLSALIKMMIYSNHTLAKNKDKIELHYHSASGFKNSVGFSSATSCAKETKYYLDVLNSIREEKINTKWMVMGYSNGGAMTIDFQNRVTDYGISIDLAFSIDPIVQTIFYPTHKIKDTIGERNENTKRFVNIYQNTDIDSLPGFQLRGKPVVNADLNILATPYNTSDLSSDGTYNHVRIVSSDRVFKATDCEFEKVFNPKSNCKWN